MNKRKIHHYWRFVKPIRAYIFIILAIFSFTIGVIGLRENNRQSVELRNQLLQIDAEGGDVEEALRQLRQHIYAHMNAELNSGEGGIRQPVQLVGTYQRLLDKEVQRASAENSTIYNDAQAFCEREFPAGFFGAGRIGCIEDYVSDRGVDVQRINEDLYKFDFVSPVWSPDAAGLGLLFGVIFSMLFMVRFIVGKWVEYIHI